MHRLLRTLNHPQTAACGFVGKVPCRGILCPVNEIVLRRDEFSGIDFSLRGTRAVREGEFETCIPTQARRCRRAMRLVYRYSGFDEHSGMRAIRSTAVILRRGARAPSRIPSHNRCDAPMETDIWPNADFAAGDNRGDAQRVLIENPYAGKRGGGASAAWTEW